MNSTEAEEMNPISGGPLGLQLGLKNAPSCGSRNARRDPIAGPHNSRKAKTTVRSVYGRACIVSRDVRHVSGPPRTTLFGLVEKRQGAAIASAIEGRVFLASSDGRPGLTSSTICGRILRRSGTARDFGSTTKRRPDSKPSAKSPLRKRNSADSSMEG